MSDAFFTPDGSVFVANGWTRGPWDPRSQHAGPPSALLGRAIDRIEPHGFRVARFTVEILKPVPIAPLTVEVRPVRTSRRVQLAEAVMRAGDEEVALARAWRIAHADDAVDPTKEQPPTADGPDGVEPWGDPAPDRTPDYFSAMEWRFARGSFFERGPAACWMRMRIPLVEGEQTDPLTRVLVAADSGNGISAELELGRDLFINTELTVHLFAMPEGEWVLLDAQTRIDAGGVGLTQSVLSDRRRRIGAGAQALLCARGR